MAAPGHTVGHTIFMITSDGKSVAAIGDLTHHQTEIRQIERDVFEAQNRTCIGLMSLEYVGRQLQRRQRHAHLNASLKFEKLEMKVDRAGQLGMPLANRV